VLFAAHNVLKDPPFSRLDLVSCRNMMIYLTREVQEQILALFHFALHPGGYLFLGNSESADSAPNLFAPLDKKHRLFKGNAVARSGLQVPTLPLGTPPRKISLPSDGPRNERGRVTFGELHQRLLEQYAPPSVIVTHDYDIVHLSDRAGRFLQFSGGEPSHNLLKVIHPELRLDLRTALFQAIQTKKSVEARRVRLKREGRTYYVNMIARPVKSDDAQQSFILVIFDEVEEILGDEGRDSDSDRQPEPLVAQLENELQRTKEQLQATIEQYETTSEEMKASNEELQAVNEELRSTAEELETSKEELQSINEELMTVNFELKGKVDEVSQVNDDLKNLISATEIATIFVDRGLRLRRFTPRALDLFNLIPTDIGRSLLDITHRLAYPEIAADAEQVLAKLTSIERELQAEDGRWYIARLLPYRTLDDRIDGAVLNFVEITARKRAEILLRQTEERLRLLIEGVNDYAIITFDTEHRITAWNAGAKVMFGYTEEEMIGQPGDLLFTPEDRERGVPEQEFLQAVRTGRAADERWHLRKDGARFYVSGAMSALRDGDARGFVKIARDLTEQKQTAEELHKHRKELETAVQSQTLELRQANTLLQIEVGERRSTEDRVKDLLRLVISAQEDERRRISRELHDHFGQQLTALRLGLESLDDLRDEPASQRRAELREMIKRLDAEVEFLAWELRPAALDELGLIAAINTFVEQWNKQTGIHAEFHTHGFEQERIPLEFESNLYRIVQEALNNVAKYAQANHVSVILERRTAHLVLSKWTKVLSQFDSFALT
jgi:two-component system, chemotaxis family, CheB/CheR fusion protein